MHASHVFSVSGGTSQPEGTCNSFPMFCAVSRGKLGWLPRGIAQFLGGATDCYPELRNFWVEQSCWARLHSFHWGG